MAGRSAVLLAVVCALVSMQCVHGFVHAQVSSMSDDCQSDFNNLLANIPAPTIDGEWNCSDAIVNATDNTDGVYCPSASVLIACFQVGQTSLCLIKSSCSHIALMLQLYPEIMKHCTHS